MPQRAFHAAGSMSVDVASTTAPVADDLVQFLMTSDDLRTVCCTPPRHRRHPSKSNLVVDAHLTQRERTPSPCLSVPGSEPASSPCLSATGYDSPPVEAGTPVREHSRTRRAPRSRERSHGSSACSLRSSSSTGQLLLSAPRRDEEEGFSDGGQATAAATGKQKSESVGDLLDELVTSLSITDVPSPRRAASTTSDCAGASPQPPHSAHNLPGDVNQAWLNYICKCNSIVTRWVGQSPT